MSRRANGHWMIVSGSEGDDVEYVVPQQTQDRFIGGFTADSVVFDSLQIDPNEVLIRIFGEEYQQDIEMKKKELHKIKTGDHFKNEKDLFEI